MRLVGKVTKMRIDRKTWDNKKRLLPKNILMDNLKPINLYYLRITNKV
jgi:hypothetical protein